MNRKSKHPALVSGIVLLFLLLLAVFPAQAASVKIKLNKTSATLYTSGAKTVRLKASVKGSRKKVSWSSSNKKVATVSASGKVTAKKAGKATITAKIGKTAAKCKVTVKTPVKINLNKTSATIYTKGTKTVQLKASVKGSKKKVSWSSSNKKVATVSASGKVTAKKAGKVTITAKIGNTTVKCKVTVKTGTSGSTKAGTSYATMYYILDGIAIRGNEIYVDKVPGIPAHATITSLKCSNKKYKVEFDNEEREIDVDLKENERSANGEKLTVSFRASKSGKTYEKNLQITMKPAPDPIVSLKIGDKEYASARLNREIQLTFGDSICWLGAQAFSGGSAVVSIKLASGYRFFGYRLEGDEFVRFFSDPYPNEIRVPLQGARALTFDIVSDPSGQPKWIGSLTARIKLY